MSYQGTDPCTNQHDAMVRPDGHHGVAGFTDNIGSHQSISHGNIGHHHTQCHSSSKTCHPVNKTCHSLPCTQLKSTSSECSHEKDKRRIQELEEDMRILKVSISNVLHAFCGLPNTNVNKELINSIEKGTISALVLFLGRLVERLEVYKVLGVNFEEIKGLLEDTSAMNCTLIAEKEMMKNEILEIVETCVTYEEVKKKLVGMLNRKDIGSHQKRSLKRPRIDVKPTKTKRVRSSQLRSRHPMYEVSSRLRPLPVHSGRTPMSTDRNGEMDQEDVIEVSSKDGDSDHDEENNNTDERETKSLEKDNNQNDSSRSRSTNKDSMMNLCLTRGQRKRGQYSHYDRITKLEMARYASDHGASKTAHHFTALLGHKVSESTVRSVMQQCSKGLCKDTEEEEATKETKGKDTSEGTHDKDQSDTSDKNMNSKSDEETSEPANDSDTTPSPSARESLPHWSTMVPDGGRRKRGQYVHYDEVMRAEIGKYALKHGVAQASRRFTKEIGRKVSESTIRGMRDQYQKLQQKGMLDISALPSCPRGAPMLLGNLDVEVQKWIKDVHMQGGLINTRVVMAAADGIVMKHAKHKLKRFGGDITITKHYARSLLRRMGLEKHKNSKDSSGNKPDDFEAIKSNFVSRVKSIVSENSVPDSLIINWNHVSCQLVPVGNWIQEHNVDQNMSSRGVDDKRQISIILAITRSGQFLPPQLIYHGKTDRCLPNGVTFPSEWDLVYSDSPLGNESTMLQYIDNIILPYISSIRKSVCARGQIQQAVALFDATEINNSQAMYQKLEDNNISSVFIPVSCKKHLQPLDLGVNETFKELMKQHFNEWYSQEVLSTLLDDTDSAGTVIDMKTVRLKPIHAQWVIKTYRELERRQDVILTGFMKAGLFDSYVHPFSSDNL